MRLCGILLRAQRRISKPALLVIICLLCALHVFPKYFEKQGNRSWKNPWNQIQKPPGKVLILSSYRSGSSLMGELVATTSTRTMYEFEPTYQAFSSEAHLDSDYRSQKCSDILNLIFNCSEHYSEEQFNQLLPLRFFSPTSYQVMKIFNTDWGDSFHWEKNPTDTEDVKEYVKFICRESSLKLVKTIRLPVLDFYTMFNLLYTLLEKFDDLVIIGVVRDPRDSFASRKKFGGGPGFEETPMSLNQICKNYSSIINFVKAIKTGPHTSRVSLVKYEEFYNDPINLIAKTFSQLSLPVGEKTINYIKLNVMNEKGGDLENTAKHGLFTKPRDKNATIGYWRALKIDPEVLEESAECIAEYEEAKSTAHQT